MRVFNRFFLVLYLIAGLSSIGYSAPLVVSLSAMPSRLKNISDIIAGIHQKADRVILSLPHKFRGKVEYDENIISKLVKRYPKLTVLRLADDIGPAMKLLPALRWLRAENYPEKTTVVTLDDDYNYGWRQDGIDVYRELAQENKAVCCEAWNLDFQSESGRESQIYTPIGSTSIGYRLATFPEDRINLLLSAIELSPDVKRSDDLLFGYFLRQWGARVEQINSYRYKFLNPASMPFDPSGGFVAGEEPLLMHGPGNIIGEREDIDKESERYASAYKILVNHFGEPDEYSPKMQNLLNDYLDEPGVVFVTMEYLNGFTPSPQAGHLSCFQCGLENNKLSRCGICKIAKYCSKKCQKLAWKNGHKKSHQPFSPTAL